MLLYAKSASERVTLVATADAGKIRLGGGYRLPVPGASSDIRWKQNVAVDVEPARPQPVRVFDAR